MFGIGGFELFIILIFGFLIFGPDKLPDIAKTVGKGIARFREAQKEMNDVIGDEKIIDLDNPDEPFKDPVEALDRIAKRQEEKKAGAAKAQSSSAKPAAKAPSAQDDEAPSEEEPKQESFTERKARYERERAARKAAEAEAAASGSTASVAENADAAEAAQPPASGASEPAVVAPTDGRGDA